VGFARDSVALPCLLLFFAACAHRGGTPPGDGRAAADASRAAAARPVVDPLRGIPEASRAAAARLEKEGDPSGALFRWKIVLAFLPGDPEANRKVESLGGRIRTEADRHYREGVEFFEKRSVPAARREFIAALSMDPGHAEALGYIEGRLASPGILSYETRGGDSARSVAAAVYGDPEKEFLVAYFSDAAAGGGLAPGRKLQLPRLDSPEGIPRKTPRRLSGMARGNASGRAATNPAARNGGPPSDEPTDAVSEEKRNAEVYRIGKAHCQRKEYQECLKALRSIDADYRDAKDLIASTESILREADRHYAEGVRRFVRQDNEGAIREWQTTLRLNPGHPQARKDLERANRLNEKVKSLP
jgi:tetratricopeptide (TPR) repeat protein